MEWIREVMHTDNELAEHIRTCSERLSVLEVMEGINVCDMRKMKKLRASSDLD